MKGWLGVDLFFILSGFVISYVHQDEFLTLHQSRFKTFLLLRLSRIYPAHLTTLLLLIPIVYFSRVLFAYESPINLFSLPKFLFSLFLLNGWGFDNSEGWNVPSWSVSSEWFAYLCFPLIAYYLNKLKSINTHILLILLVYFVMYSLAIVLNDATQFMLSSRFLLTRVFSEFLVGCCLFNINKLSNSSSKGNYLTTLSLLSIVILCILPISNFFDGIIIIAFTVLIYGISQSGPVSTALFANPTMLYLGKISYSIYLTHSIVLMCFNQIIKRTLGQPNAPLQVILLIFVLTLIIISGHLLFHWIEDPFRRKVKQKLQSS